MRLRAYGNLQELRLTEKMKVTVPPWYKRPQPEGTQHAPAGIRKYSTDRTHIQHEQTKPEGTQRAPEGTGIDTDTKLQTLSEEKQPGLPTPPRRRDERQNDGEGSGAAEKKGCMGTEEDRVLNKIDSYKIKKNHTGKSSSDWQGTPPSGEPGEPRWPMATLRTPSPMPRDHNGNQNRKRNYGRGFRSSDARKRRQDKRASSKR